MNNGTTLSLMIVIVLQVIDALCLLGMTAVAMIDYRQTNKLHQNGQQLSALRTVKRVLRAGKGQFTNKYTNIPRKRRAGETSDRSAVLPTEPNSF